jgi:hypothetical protein
MSAPWAKKTQTHPLSYSSKLSRERKRNVYQNVAVKLAPKQKNTTTYMYIVPLEKWTIQEIKHKHRYWTRCMENRDPKKYKEFVRSRNKVKTMVRKAKLQMEKELAIAENQGLKLAFTHSPFASKFQCGPLKISSQSSTWRVKIRKNKIQAVKIQYGQCMDE